MQIRRAIVGTLAASILLVPSTAVAKGGGGGGGSSSNASPGPCVSIVADNAGNVTSGGVDTVDFTATSCSSATHSYATSVADQAWRVLYPGIQCLDASYAGPSITVQPGRETRFSLPIRHGSCFPAAEYHSIAVTATTVTGALAATAFSSWSDKVRTESA